MAGYVWLECGMQIAYEGDRWCAAVLWLPCRRLEQACSELSVIPLKNTSVYEWLYTVLKL